MARVKNGATTKARHKKVLKQAKGYFGSKHRLYKTAKEQLMHSGQYAFRDRKQKKRDFRKLWITRINAACRQNDISYSRFIEGLTKAGVEINRKMLSEIAIDDSKAFAAYTIIAFASICVLLLATVALIFALYGSGSYQVMDSVVGNGFQMGFNVFNDNIATALFFVCLSLCLSVVWVVLGRVFEDRAFKKASHLAQMIHISEHRMEMRRWEKIRTDSRF